MLSRWPSGTHFTEQPQHAKAPAVDLELRSARKAEDAVGEGIEYIHECLRHVGRGRSEDPSSAHERLRTVRYDVTMRDEVAGIKVT